MADRIFRHDDPGLVYQLNIGVAALLFVQSPVRNTAKPVADLARLHTRIAAALSLKRRKGPYRCGRGPFLRFMLGG